MSKTAVKIIGASCAAAGAFAAVSCITFRELLHRNAFLPPLISKFTEKAMAKDVPAPEPDERALWFDRQQFEEYTICNSRGYNLRGYLLRADKPSDTYVFCSHGYRNHGKGEFNYITKFHHDAGRNVFIVDHQAAGESEGTYIGFGYHESKDCMQWLSFMLDSFGSDIKIILHGVSMGCATILMMCGDEALPQNVKFAVADCGFTSALNEFRYNLKNAHVPSFPIVQGVSFVNKQINGFDFKEISPIESVQNAKIPILFIHGKIDTFVPTFMATQLYNACASEHKELLLVDDAWHAESYRKNSAAYEEKVNSFADAYVNEKQAEKAS